MCGRYVSPDESAIEREFNLVRTEWTFPASFNVAPSQNVPVIRNFDGAMNVTAMRWGLVPFFAKGVPGKYSTINARMESVETSASFRAHGNAASVALFPAQAFTNGTSTPMEISSRSISRAPIRRCLGLRGYGIHQNATTARC